MVKTTTVSDDKGVPAPVVAVARPQSWLREVLDKTLFSSKLWATAVSCWYLWGDHWSDIQVLNGFAKDDAAKITAFVDLCRSKNDTLKYVMLGFLGFQTATGIGVGITNRFAPANVSTNRNTRADRE